MHRGSSFSPAVEFIFVDSVKRGTTEWSLPGLNRTIRVSITITFCIKKTSYKLVVAYRNPGTDGTPNAINVSRHHYIQTHFAEYRPSPNHATVTFW